MKQLPPKGLAHMKQVQKMTPQAPLTTPAPALSPHQETASMWRPLKMEWKGGWEIVELCSIQLTYKLRENVKLTLMWCCWRTTQSHSMGMSET